MTKKIIKNSIPAGVANAARILLRPRVTEKAHMSIALGKYVFQVVPTATKRLVKESIESLYNVSVEAVHIVRIPKKRRVFGRIVGWKSPLKKAIVTLKKGEQIELFKGL